jgi:hypothetical protein
LKPGVVRGSPIPGEEIPEGVEACSVANRSGVGEEATGRLHASNMKRRKRDDKSLSLVIFPFNRLKKKFFTG